MNPAAQSGIREHYAAHKPEPGGKADAKCYDEGADIGRCHYRPQVHILFMKDVVKADIIQQDVQQGIASPAYQITKGLDINELPERRVKTVDNGYDEIPRHFARAKVGSFRYFCAQV